MVNSGEFGIPTDKAPQAGSQVVRRFKQAVLAQDRSIRSRVQDEREHDERTMRDATAGSRRARDVRGTTSESRRLWGRKRQLPARSRRRIHGAQARPRSGRAAGPLVTADATTTQRDSREAAGPGQPNQTKPNQTKPDGSQHTNKGQGLPKR
jgi:hypothetical protein